MTTVTQVSSAAAQPLRIIFAGTPAFAAVALQELLRTEHHIVGVYTQPDRPAGRGLKLTPSPVKQLALQHQLPLLQPVTLRDPAAQSGLAQLQADVMIVAAYGLLLPSAVLTAPRLGCINIHPSLLPRWRGAAPIQRSILAGDSVTGVCIMQMAEGLDTGPVLARTDIPILTTDTSATLHDKLAELGAALLVRTLPALAAQTLRPQEQPAQGVTYAKKFSKEDARIDWQASARDIDLQIRGFNPWPTAFTSKDGFTFKIWQVRLLATAHADAAPGTILAVDAAGITVATGHGQLVVEKLQFAGGNVITASAIYNAHPAAVGGKTATLPSFRSGERMGAAPGPAE